MPFILTGTSVFWGLLTSRLDCSRSAFTIGESKSGLPSSFSPSEQNYEFGLKHIKRITFVLKKERFNAPLKVNLKIIIYFFFSIKIRASVLCG